MVNIYQHTQYCEGRGYVNPRSFSDAMSREKTNTRVTRDAAELLTKGELTRQAVANPVSQQQATRPTPAAQLLRPFVAATNFIRQVFRPILQLPAQLVQTGVRAAQQMQQSPNFIVRATGLLLCFVLGQSKRARNQRDDDDDTLRQDNDPAVVDSLTFTAIKEPSASMMGQNS